LLATTLTGQLSLLMLIEELEFNDIPVVSANTDGIVIHPNYGDDVKVDAIVKWWEKRTSFNLEETRYALLASRDVNSYVAVKPDGEVKGRGAYRLSSLRKNVAGDIVIKAVYAFIADRVPLLDTIKNCREIRDFLFIRTVRGGAVYNGAVIGKVVRWYYGTSGDEPMRYLKSNNKVPMTDGCVPTLVIPKKFPEDIDYTVYEKMAEDMLFNAGFDYETLGSFKLY
jgi:hypothetical protein